MTIKDNAGREFQPGPELKDWKIELLTALNARAKQRVHYADACDRVERSIQRARQFGVSNREIQEAVSSFHEQTRF